MRPFAILLAPGALACSIFVFEVGLGLRAGQSHSDSELNLKSPNNNEVDRIDWMLGVLGFEKSEEGVARMDQVIAALRRRVHYNMK